MDLKRNKVAGYDGVVNEHLIFSDHHLRVHLSLLFTAMLRHSFVPDDFCNGIIVPLLKSKHGDVLSFHHHPRFNGRFPGKPGSSDSGHFLPPLVLEEKRTFGSK